MLIGVFLWKNSYNRRTMTIVERDQLTEKDIVDLSHALKRFKNEGKPLERASLTPEMLEDFFEQFVGTYGKAQEFVMPLPDLTMIKNVFSHLDMPVTIPQTVKNKRFGLLQEALSYDRIQFIVSDKGTMITFFQFGDVPQTFGSIPNHKGMVDMFLTKGESKISYYNYKNAEYLEADPHKLSPIEADFFVSHFRIAAASIESYIRSMKETIPDQMLEDLSHLDMTGI